jgi:hypothetical protein
MLTALGVVVSSCAATTDSPGPIDLLAALPAAERRAAGNVDEAVRVGQVFVDNGHEPALLLRAPARVTWTLRLPPRSALSASARLAANADGSAGAGVTLRVGLSDDRFYEGVLSEPVGGEWRPVTADLGKYSGWQWSLFYRPSEIAWKLILNADATPGGTVALRGLSIRHRD